MPRMRILSATEQEQFEKPPYFDAQHRKKFLESPEGELETAQTFRKPSHQIGFLVSCGYFKATKRFFSPKDYHQRDIDYVARRLDLDPKIFNNVAYANRTRQRHEHIILEVYGFKRFKGEVEQSIILEIANMVQSQLKPKMIFFRCVDTVMSQRTQVPNYHRLTDLILSALNQRKQDLSALIKQTLTPQSRHLLDGLFTQGEGDNTTEDTTSPSSKTVSYRLTLLKKLSQSTRPTKVRKRVEDLADLMELYLKLKPVWGAMNLTHEGIRYYAGSVIKSLIFQLNQRSDEDRYVHVIAFIAHQYFRLHDNLIDVFLKVVQSFQNTSQREHKEQIYCERKICNANLTNLLSRLDEDVFAVIRKIMELAHDAYLSDTDKICNIRSLLKTGKDDQLAGLKTGLERELSEDSYFKVLESRSLRLQTRVSPIVPQG